MLIRVLWYKQILLIKSEIFISVFKRDRQMTVGNRLWTGAPVHIVYQVRLRLYTANYIMGLT